MERRRAAPAVLAVVLVLAGCVGGVGPETESGGPTDAPTTRPAPGDSRVLSPETGPNGTLAVHFLNVGQSSAVLVVGPTGETMLVDSGNYRDDGEHVLSYLRDLGITRIDHLVTTHADADHVGGHAAVIDHFETRADGVGAIYDPGIAASTRTYEAYLDAVEEHDVTLYRTQAGDAVPMEGVDVRVLGPPDTYIAERERNENSVVLRLGFGNASVLLPGDAGRAAERDLVRRYGRDLNATVLYAGHHGSSTSTSDFFLDMVRPSAVVISSAYDSPYGHPHDETLRRLADRSTPTYWTAAHGHVVTETDGENVSVRTQRAATTNPDGLREADPVSPGTDAGLVQRAVFDAAGSQAPVAVADGGASDAGTTAAVADSALAVATIHADAAGDDRENLNDEYVVFENRGDSTLALGGWTVADEADHSYVFPQGTTLAPGARLTLHTGAGEDGETDRYWGADGPVWNNDGDTVFVRTANGTLVAEESYS